MFDVSLPWASFWYDAFNILLFVGAVAVAVGTYGAIKMGAVKERFSDERISANEAETARAVADSDIAKKATVEAALELEKERVERLKLAVKVAPRSISQAEQQKLTAALTGLDIQVGTIKASPQLPESEWFARILAAPLRAAGWDIKPIQGDNSNTVLKPTGVIIQYATVWSAENGWVPTKSPAAEKLAELLNGLGIEATAIPKTLPPMKPPTTMEIIISTK